MKISPRSILTGFGAVLLCMISYRACSSCSDTRETTALATPPPATAGAAAQTAPIAAPAPAPPPAAPSRSRAADEYVGALTTRRTAVVSVEFEARVEELLVNMGDKVMLGDPLARMDERPLRQKLTAAQAAAEAAEATVRSASLDLEDAQRRVERERGDFRDEGNADIAMAEASLKKSEDALRAARADVLALERQVASATLTAPMAGIVSVVRVRPGQLLAPGTVLLRIFDPAEVRVRFAVPPEHVARMRNGTRVVLSVTGSGVKVPGTVRQVAPELEPAGRVVLVEAELDEGADALRRLPVQIGAVGRVRLARPPG
jgi:RND family efflux transporter MFP subunit